MILRTVVLMFCLTFSSFAFAQKRNLPVDPDYTDFANATKKVRTDLMRHVQSSSFSRADCNDFLGTGQQLISQYNEEFSPKGLYFSHVRGKGFLGEAFDGFLTLRHLTVDTSKFDLPSFYRKALFNTQDILSDLEIDTLRFTFNSSFKYFFDVSNDSFVLSIPNVYKKADLKKVVFKNSERFLTRASLQIEQEYVRVLVRSQLAFVHAGSYPQYSNYRGPQSSVEQRYCKHYKLYVDERVSIHRSNDEKREFKIIGYSPVVLDHVLSQIFSYFPSKKGRFAKDLRRIVAEIECQFKALGVPKIEWNENFSCEDLVQGNQEAIQKLSQQLQTKLKRAERKKPRAQSELRNLLQDASATRIAKLYETAFKEHKLKLDLFNESRFSKYGKVANLDDASFELTSEKLENFRIATGKSIAEFSRHIGLTRDGSWSLIGRSCHDENAFPSGTIDLPAAIVKKIYDFGKQEKVYPNLFGEWTRKHSPKIPFWKYRI